jgi:hypothetical protein
MSRGGKVIISVGFLIILILSVCAFFKSDIEYMVVTKNIDRLYGTTVENDYFIEDNFDYVDNASDAILTSKKDVINTIYFLINSGTTYSERYCSKDYENCFNDINELSSDVELLTNLNNYVHPYNSFDNISFSFNNEVVQIKIEHIYSEDDINTLNKIVDEFINNNITNSMGTKEKIRIIHDYIINNADYDILKTKNKDDNTYRSSTAYGVLVQGYGICSGYSDAMAIFLDKLNIINYKISNDQHIWNLVYLDGEWLHLDLTWDDPISDSNITRDNYFLISTKNLETLDDGVHYYNKSIFTEAV